MLNKKLSLSTWAGTVVTGSEPSPKANTPGSRCASTYRPEIRTSIFSNWFFHVLSPLPPSSSWAPSFSFLSVFHTVKQLWNQAARRRVWKINIAYLSRLSNFFKKKGVFNVEKICSCSTKVMGRVKLFYFILEMTLCDNLNKLWRLLSMCVCLKAASAVVVFGVDGLSHGVNSGSVVEQWTQTHQGDQEHEVSTWCSLHVVWFMSQISSSHVTAFRLDDHWKSIVAWNANVWHKCHHVI